MGGELNDQEVVLEGTKWSGSCIRMFWNLFLIFFLNRLNLFYKDQTFENKLKNGVVFIFLAGLATIVLSKYFQRPEKEYTESIISMGLGLGGVLLLLTAILVNWSGLTDDLKLIISSITFGIIIYYAFKYDSRKQSLI